MVIVIVIHRCI